jgi:uncharacterized membrane protein
LGGLRLAAHPTSKRAPSRVFVSRHLSEKLKEADFYLQFSEHTLHPMSQQVSVSTAAIACASPSAPSTVRTGAPVQATGLQGPRRRIVYVSLYEAIAIVVSSLIFMAIGQEAGASSVMAVAASAIAICWNLSFNYLFEKWEARQSVKGRSVLRRVVHAMGFEGGIAAMLIPLMAWWFDVSLWQAAVMEAGLLVFFLVYTYVFNWGFDRLFGLPASAQG